MAVFSKFPGSFVFLVEKTPLKPRFKHAKVPDFHKPQETAPKDPDGGIQCID